MDYSPLSPVASHAHRANFHALHQDGCFVIPNPWDVGSARYLQSLGFLAVATTSAGFAFSQGLPDSDFAVSRERCLSHIAEIVRAVELPVSADFGSGYAVEPWEVAESVKQCIATGVAGLSLEDATGDRKDPLYELPFAVERVAAARRAIDEAGGGVLLTARAECYHVGHPNPLREAIRRLQAYAEAGADVLFAPGPREPEDIKLLVESIRPKPLNLLVVGNSALSVDEIAALGVRRISVGGGLALTAWGGFMRAALELRSQGSFAGFATMAPFTDVNDFLAADLRWRLKAGL